MNADVEKNTLTDIALTNTLIEQERSVTLGITKEYNKENRDKLWDSTKGKKDFKDKTFGSRNTYQDDISGNVLHRHQNAAQSKYHMKDKQGQNISSKWAEHSSETDHINALKDTHNIVKYNPFLSDADFKEIMNSEENYRILSKSLNTSKGDKNDWELVFDQDNGLSNKARIKIAEEKLKSDVALHSKFGIRTAENVGKEFFRGATDTVVNSVIPLSVEAVRKMFQVAQRKKTINEATEEIGGIVLDIAVMGGTAVLLNTAITDIMTNSKNTFLNNIAENNEVGLIIAAAAIVKESAIRYINGEIDGKEFIEETSEKGVTIAMGMLGGQIGKRIGGLLGKSVGMAVGPIGVVAGGKIGELTGQILGAIVTTVVCGNIVSIHNTVKNLDNYKLKETQIRRIESDALKEMSVQREKFRTIILSENKKIDKQIKEGIDMILYNACKETYSLSGVTEGLDKILAIFGKEVVFKSLDEYEAQLGLTLKLG